MKTSVIEVHAMLSVLSVDEVEKRIGEVPGVDSVTVNYAAGSATVRYDETRLEVADIKSAVRQRGFESAAPAAAVGDGHEDHTAPGAPPATTAPAAPNTPPITPATADATSEGAAQVDKAVPHAAPSTPIPAAPKPFPAAPAVAPAPVSAAPKSAPDAAAAPEAHAGKGHAGHTAPGTQPAMSADMAHDMGHGGNMDLPAMVRDMRNRFWICLIFTVPIFFYSPMGLFTPPAPPFRGCPS